MGRIDRRGDFMINPEIQTTLSFQPAEWLQSFALALFGHRQWYLLRQDYFIALAQDNLCLSDAHRCYQVSATDYMCTRDPLCIKNKIIVGRLVDKRLKTDHAIALKKIDQRATKLIIQLESAEINQALCAIYNHLKLRTSDRSLITEQGAIQNIFSQIIEQSSILKTLIKNFADPADDYDDCSIQYAKKLITSICLDLAKLQGGQGFLYGGMIEMHWFFQIIHTIYLA